MLHFVCLQDKIQAEFASILQKSINFVRATSFYFDRFIFFTIDSILNVHIVAKWSHPIWFNKFGHTFMKRKECEPRRGGRGSLDFE